MEWVSTTLGGGKINQFPTVFTEDSKYFFCPSGDSVKMFSVTTGEQTRILQGHTGKVIGTAINPENPLQLYSFSRDGKIGLWDYNDAVLLSTMEVGFSPRQFALSQHKNRHVVYLCEKVSLPDVDKAAVYRAKMKKREVKTYSGCHIYAFDLKTRSAPQKLVSMKFCLEMQVTPDGEYLVVRGRKSVKLVDLSDGKVVKYKHPHLIKCIAVHPKQHFVAFGNIRGEIMFLHCFGKPNAGVGVGTGSGTVGTRHVAIEKAVTSAQRWHQVAVQCLAFDAEGTYMYSGGRESVVVIWQLESGNRDFIPRLGAAILGLTLSPDQLLLAVRMSDNSIKFANTRSRASEGVVEGINAPPSQRLLTGLQVEPRDQSFVFNVSDGQLQFYNAREDRSIRKLQVATKNPLHYFRNTLIPDHIVQSVAFSKKGEWLVTVDRSPSEVAATSYDSTTLKFWLYDERQRRYELNTQINDPHTGEITGLAYNPSGDMCVTSSSDGKFKVWVLVERQSDEDDDEAEGDNNAENVRKDNADDKPSEGLTLPPPPAPSAAASSPAETMCWACRSVGFFRDLRATAAAFSTDGSILAVAYEHIITLWNPTTNSLISTLTCAVPQEAITHLAFLHGAVPYLVACSEYRLYVWDLLTCQVAWSHVVPVKLLALDTLSARFAIYAPHRGQVPEKGSIIIWEPSSPKPLLLARSQGGLVKGLCFAPPMSPIASSAPASSVSSVDAPRSGVLPSSGPRSAVAEAESVLVYMDKSNHMICLEHVSTEKKSALLRKKKRSQAAASAPASAIAALQSPAALMKDNFHKQMNAKTLSEGPNVFMQLYGGDPEVQLDVKADESNAEDQNDSEDENSRNEDDDDDAMDVDTALSARVATSSRRSRSGSLPQIGKKAVQKAQQQQQQAEAASASTASAILLERFIAQLDAPSHSLPTTTALFQQFADALIIRHDAPGPVVASSPQVPAGSAVPTDTSKMRHHEERTKLNDVTAQHKEQELFSEARLLEREVSGSGASSSAAKGPTPAQPYAFLYSFFSSGTIQAPPPSSSIALAPAPASSTPTASGSPQMPRSLPSTPSGNNKPKSASKSSVGTPKSAAKEKASTPSSLSSAGTKKRKRSGSGSGAAASANDE